MGFVKSDKNYYREVIEDYCDGKATIKGEHPKEVLVAIDTFFHAGKMLMDNPEISHVPMEYVNNLLKALSAHPQYKELLEDLLNILDRYISPGGE